jgi:hypothetical protein
LAIPAGPPQRDKISSPAGWVIRVASPARSSSNPAGHLQFGQGLVADVDRSQRVRQRAGRIGDEERPK